MPYGLTEPEAKMLTLAVVLIMGTTANMALSGLGLTFLEQCPRAEYVLWGVRNALNVAWVGFVGFASLSDMWNLSRMPWA